MAMTRARDRSNWFHLRADLHDYLPFLHLMDLLGVPDQDADGRDLMVGRIYRLWSRLHNRPKRFDTLHDLHRLTGLGHDVLEAMTHKKVGFIRRVKPTAAERADRIERNFTPEEAAEPWFEVQMWKAEPNRNVNKGSGDRKTDTEKERTGGATADSSAPEAAKSNGLAGEPSNRPAPKDNSNPRREVIAEINHLMATEKA